MTLFPSSKSSMATSAAVPAATQHLASPVVGVSVPQLMGAAPPVPVPAVPVLPPVPVLVPAVLVLPAVPVTPPVPVMTPEVPAVGLAVPAVPGMTPEVPALVVALPPLLKPPGAGALSAGEQPAN